MDMVMNLKKNLFLLLTVLIGSAQAMEENSPNALTPYLPAAAASFAVARYCPDLAHGMLPPDSLSQMIIPPVLKYGGYCLGAHLLLKQYNANYLSDALHSKNVLVVAKKSLNAAPAIVCHPKVAHGLSNACMAFTVSHMNNASQQLLAYALPSAFMVGGAITAGYLINHNIFSNALTIEKIKTIKKDAQAYSFVLPLLVSHNSDAIKNCIMSYAPEALNENLKSDGGSLIKNGLYYGGLCGAFYLFATDSLGLATQKYVKSKINELMVSMQAVRGRFNKSVEELKKTGSLFDALDKSLHTELQYLLQQNQITNEEFEKISEELKRINTDNGRTQEIVTVLERNAKDLVGQTQSIEAIAAEVAINLAELKREHAQKMLALREQLKNADQELLQEFKRNNDKVNARIIEIETACQAGTIDLEDTHTKLTKLIVLLKKEGQTYHQNAKSILAAIRLLVESTGIIDQMSTQLGQLTASLHGEQTPGGPEADAKSRQTRPA